MAGMKFTLPTGAALLMASTLATGCTVTLDSQSQIVREEKRFTVTGAPDLHVNTFDGSIRIQSWDRPEVLVEIEKRGPTRESIEQLEVKTTQNGDRIELEVKKPRTESFSGIGFHRSASARLVVSMPRRATINARSGDGSINVDGLEGRIQLHTGDGSIRASDVIGELTFDTGDGSITVEGAGGTLDLATGDGSVNVSGKLTRAKLHTGDGSIVYRAPPGTAMTEDWEITTGDGSVSVYLPNDFAAELDAHTGDGTIKNDLAVSPEPSGPSARRTVRGRLGAGGKLLRIRTGDGSIRLRSF